MTRLAERPLPGEIHREISGPAAARSSDTFSQIVLLPFQV